MLTELNRELLLFKNFRKINREFVCSDLNSMDISDILLKDKVQFYLNFAAIKHVRSEENIQSIKYMFKTNSINFVPRKLMNFKNIVKHQRACFLSLEMALRMYFLFFGRGCP